MTDNQKLIADSMSEDRLLENVIDQAHVLGYRVAHFRPAMKQDGTFRTPVQADGKGFPDLVLVRAPDVRMIYAECKSQKGKLSPEQKDWYELLCACQGEIGVEVYLWYPVDWLEGTIVRILK